LKITQNVNNNKSHASRQYLGYSLQTTRFLFHLLISELKWSVSLEVFDDVGVETPDGKILAEQDKSSLTSNPISNHALDLWKTFSNWVDSVKAGEVNPEKTNFVLYVSHENKGQIAEKFSESNNLSEAHQAFVHARDVLWGPAPSFPLKNALPKQSVQYMENVFTSNKELICNIIRNFRLEFGSGSPQQDLMELFEKQVKYVGSEMVESAFRYILGWVQDVINRLIEQNRPACISVESFTNEIASFIRKYDRRNILLTYARAPSKSEIAEDLKVKKYVRQLDIIEIDDDRKIRAVTDYLRASVDRTQWGKLGLVHQSSFDDFQDTLIRSWDSHKLKSETLVGYSDLNKGRHLYAECTGQQFKLENLEVPSHFTPGSYHALADVEIIGWHPSFKEKLKKNTIEENT
jgi:hypothetical protein